MALGVMACAASRIRILLRVGSATAWKMSRCILFCATGWLQIYATFRLRKIFLRFFRGGRIFRAWAREGASPPPKDHLRALDRLAIDQQGADINPRCRKTMIINRTWFTPFCRGHGHPVDDPAIHAGRTAGKCDYTKDVGAGSQLIAIDQCRFIERVGPVRQQLYPVVSDGRQAPAEPCRVVRSSTTIPVESGPHSVENWLSVPFASTAAALI